MSDLSLKFLLFGEDRTASKSIKGVGTQAGSTASLVAGGLGKIGNAIGGEVGDMVNKVSEGFNQLGERGKGLGAKMAVGGAAMTGLGAAFQAMASGDVQAQNQLKTAVDNTGQSYSDYKDKIEETIKHQENFGNSAVQTQDALRVLTQATNDPKKALEMMGTVADLAAAKHISLSDAALKVAKVYGGAGKVLKEFGITMGSNKKDLAALSSATKAHETAVTTLQKAQQKLTDLEAKDHAKKHLTVADQIALRTAHENVDKALGKVKTTTEKMTTAQGAANKSTHAADNAISELAKKVKGQAAASVDTFTGKLNVMRVKATDAAAAFGAKFGPAITMAGVGVTALGTVVEILRGRQVAASVATNLETAATTRQTIASKVAAAGQWLWNAALTANPIGLVIAAIALLVGIIYLIATKTTWFQTIWRVMTEALGATWRWVWNSILKPVTQFILNGFAAVAGAIGHVLSALGRIPGFGWAKTAANFMLGAADKARSLANNLHDIKSPPPIQVRYYVSTFGAAPVLPGSHMSLNNRMRAAGGPVSKGMPYIVGEHRAEVFVPDTNGTILPRVGAFGGSGSAAAGGGQPLVVQMMLDGRVLHQSLLALKRTNGGGLALG